MCSEKCCKGRKGLACCCGCSNETIYHMVGIISIIGFFCTIMFIIRYMFWGATHMSRIFIPQSLLALFFQLAISSLRSAFYIRTCSWYYKDEGLKISHTRHYFWMMNLMMAAELILFTC